MERALFQRNSEQSEILETKLKSSITVIVFF